MDTGGEGGRDDGKDTFDALADKRKAAMRAKISSLVDRIGDFVAAVVNNRGNIGRDKAREALVAAIEKMDE